MDEAAEAFYDQLRDEALADAEKLLRDDDDTDERLAAQVLAAHRAAWEEGRQCHVEQFRKAIEAGERDGWRRASHASLTPAS
jgi:hypothetical protein